MAACLLVSGCGSGVSPTPAQYAAPLLPAGAHKRCVVLLHGKGGKAMPSSVADGVEFVRPAGNGTGWKGREWRYFPEAQYEQMRALLAGNLDAAGCAQVILQGFSNGGAAAAKLYCRGEDFGGRVIGYIVDDPVPDNGVLGCKPPASLRIRLYWTGGLAVATDGWSCATQDWTCEGGQTIGITRYARELATDIAPSANTTHTEYVDPPEATDWFSQPAN